jgi:hypothetical protein
VITIKNVISISLSILFITNCYGQNTQQITVEDTVFFDIFKGEIVFNGFYQADTLIRNGKVNFQSKLIKSEDGKVLNKLDFNGEYKNNLKHGLWGFNEHTYKVDLLDIKTGRQFSIDYDLDGKERHVKTSYSYGVPEGKWTISKSEIINKKKSSVENFGELNFINGYAVSIIRYDSKLNNVFIDAQLTEEGFFHGEMNLKYLDSTQNKKIHEKRQYENGFLTRLEKTVQGEEKPFVKIVYLDIEEKLGELSQNESSLNFEVADSSFGLLFNNGYQQDDERLIGQKEGNNAIQVFLDAFEKYIKDCPNEQIKPVYKFTKRLHYTYPEEDQKKIAELTNKVGAQCSLYEKFIGNASYKLYKEKSDSLTEAIAFVKRANEKCNILLKELNRMSSTFFDHEYRNNYYKKGITGLDQQKNYQYINSKGDTIVKSFEIGVRIDSYDELFSKIEEYSYNLNNLVSKYKEVANKQIKLFSRQATIDSLDQEIVTNNEVLDSLYKSAPKPESNFDFNELPFTQQIYMVHYHKTIRDIKEKYLNAEEFESKKRLGEDFICFQSSLIDNHERYNKITRNQKALDSTFTIYKEHPFDNRLFESPVLGNIKEKGGRRLFYFYTEELFRTSDCGKIEKIMVKIETLQARLEEISRDLENEEYIRINRLLRRESVPNRIERLLGLEE